MNLTIPIRPEVEAELARQAAARGSAVEVYAAALLEEAMHIPQAKTVQPPAVDRTGQMLIDAFADIRDLLSDDEIDQMFQRNPSPARPVDLS
jgi:hypothetical protein